MPNCPNCARPLQPDQYRGNSVCKGCQTTLESAVFPALAREQDVVRSEGVDESGLASCFYHPAKKAVMECDHCGRFLCALCDLEVGGQHLCSACLSRGHDASGVTRQNQGYTRHDMVALGLTVWPFILFPPLIVFAAPFAIYYCFRHYNTPLSIIPVRRWRFPLAVLFAAIEIIGCALLLYWVLQ